MYPRSSLASSRLAPGFVSFCTSVRHKFDHDLKAQKPHSLKVQSSGRRLKDMTRGWCKEPRSQLLCANGCQNGNLCGEVLQAVSYRQESRHGSQT